MQEARHTYVHEHPFAFQRGGTIPRVELAFETWGQLNDDRSNAILLMTGLSPSAHAASSQADPSPGWWEFMVGPRKPIDTDRFFVLCVNSLGSCLGSTGPASTNPQTGERYGPSFPPLSIEDIARSAHLVVEHLGIERLYAIIGPSMGGMSAMAYALAFPDAAARVGLISSTLASGPFSIAIRSLQRDAIVADPHFDAGHYTEPPVAGMRIARKIGMLSYRSANEWNQRFGRDRIAEFQTTFGVPEFEIQSYLTATAEKFITSFDANSYLYLSRAMDWFDANEHQPSLDQGLRQSGVERAQVIGVRTDLLFPIHQQAEQARALRQAGIETEFVVLAALQGHDAFLIDETGFSPPIRRFLA